MKRWQRIALQILAPPALGGAIALIAIGCIAVWEHWQKTGTWRVPIQDAGVWFLFAMIWAYVLAIIPSAIYAALMEWRFARGLRPGSLAAIIWSSGLGGISGFAIIAVIFRGPGDGWIFAAFTLLGLVVGVIVGVLVRRGTNDPSNALR